MLSLVKAVGTLVSKASLPKRIVESIETVSPEVQAKLDRSLRQATLDTLTVCSIVCRSILAERLGVAPTSDQVNDFMSKVADDPRFAHRAFRLFGEAQKSSDGRRRVFLASMLFGLPFSTIPDDERDRVDIAVERMNIPDVELLATLWERRRTPEMHKPDGISYIFGQDGLGVVADGQTARIATPNEWTGTDFVGGFFDNPQFVVDRAALASLVSIGCVDIGETVMTFGETQTTHHLRLLPLAHLVVRALEDVRAGFAATE